MITIIPPKETDQPAEDNGTTPKPTTPASTAPATPDASSDFSPSVEDLTPESQGKVSLSDSKATAGQNVTVTVGEQYAGQAVKAVVFSEPQQLGDITVSQDGTVQVQLPANLERGEHSLVIYDADGEVIGWQQLEIVETPGDEPATGGNVPGDPAVGNPSSTPAPTPNPSASDDEATTAPLSVIPPANGGNSAPQADTGGLAVTGPANVTPIIAIVALGVAAGLGLLIVARRDRMDA